LAKSKIELAFIDIDSIKPNPEQPRERISKEGLRELAESIKVADIVQPILVRKHGKGYQIIAGERRWKAAQIVGQKRIPAIVKELDDNRLLVESLIENLHRVDLEDVERENAIHDLLKTKLFKSTTDLAKAIGITKDKIEEDLDAWQLRHKERLPETVSTRVIRGTQGLEPSERRAIIQRVELGEIKAKDVDTAAKVVRKASEPIRRELLKPKSPITPRMAETIVEKVPSEKEQEIVLKEAKQYRLTEDEVQDRVRDIARAREKGIEPVVERVTVVQGQWLYDRLRRSAEELLTVNIDAHTELTERQKRELVKLLKSVQGRLNQWLQRLEAVKVIDT
jgi:ParB family chromosome partitioning protein